MKTVITELPFPCEIKNKIKMKVSTGNLEINFLSGHLIKINTQRQRAQLSAFGRFPPGNCCFQTEKPEAAAAFGRRFSPPAAVGKTAQNECIIPD